MRIEAMKAARVKAGRYCAYQERTQQEVRDKLYNLGLHQDEVEEVLSDLIIENFVNEERFAKTFASGKFRQKRWGKKKIVFELKHRNISSYCIDQALKEIPDVDYKQTMIKLIDKKSAQVSGDIYIIKNKTARYMINKGYEMELVWSLLNERL